MSNPLPSTTPLKVIKALQRAGFEIDHQTGSHILMRNVVNKKIVIVPNHNKDIKKGTLKSILTQAGLSTEELIAFL